jgi:hypothetical protein
VNVQVWAVLLWLAIQVSPPQARQRTFVEVPSTSARYESLQTEALRFFRAVRNRDHPTLVRLSPAGDRDAIRKDLDNPTSPVSRMLLTGSRAMRGRFMSVQTPRVTLLREQDTRDAGERVIVCFSDPQQEFKAPATVAGLPAADSNRAEMCVPVVYAERKWEFVFGGRL